MKYRDERLYLVTTDGSLVCVDASEAAITATQQGTVPVARDVKLAAALPTYAPATAAGAGRHRRHAPAGAVVVECVQDGGRLRVHVVSEGCDSSWNVQFPCTVRSPGHATSWTPCTRRPAASTASPVTSGDCCDQGVRSKGQPAAARSIRSAAVRSPSRARMVSEALARVSRSSVSPSNAARAPCSSSSVNRYGSSRTP